MRRKPLPLACFHHVVSDCEIDCSPQMKVLCHHSRTKHNSLFSYGQVALSYTVHYGHWRCLTLRKGWCFTLVIQRLREYCPLLLHSVATAVNILLQCWFSMVHSVATTFAVTFWSPNASSGHMTSIDVNGTRIILVDDVVFHQQLAGLLYLGIYQHHQTTLKYAMYIVQQLCRCHSKWGYHTPRINKGFVIEYTTVHSCLFLTFLGIYM